MGNWIKINGKPVYVKDEQFMSCEECSHLLEEDDENRENREYPSTVPYNKDDKWLCEDCVEWYKEEMAVQNEINHDEY